jgi:protein Mpv17
MKGVIGGIGGFWKWPPFDSQRRRRKDRRSKPSDWSDSTGGVSDYQFPLKQALTAGGLALAGDTIAQLRQRWVKAQALEDQSRTHPNQDDSSEDVTGTLLSDHDNLRALRMASYGFLFYGPGSYAWYQYLDQCMPKQTVENLLIKILLNQIVLGPSVIAVVFAWNNLWQGKLLELPNKYKNDALPTLFTGFRFWIPVSALNFGVVPLQARVAFMSMGSIFWNFYLSSTMNK